MKKRFTLSRRTAGVLLHPTSLPGPFGCGDLGPSAREFAGFLAAAGQTWWQMLPVGPIGAGNSPYNSCSAFAGNDLLVSPEKMRDAGWLSREEVRRASMPSGAKARFASAARVRRKLLEAAYRRFRVDRRWNRVLNEFAALAGAWLDDYALYRALRQANAGRPWVEWPREVRDRRPAALREARRALDESIEYERFVQAVFDLQWRELRGLCRQRGIGLIGDLPIFVSHDSADVWAHRELFQLDKYGRAKVVSGCPPDGFSPTGQLWGHPLYAWPAHARSGFAWWIARFKRMFELFDAVRIDHFLGFHRCWTIPGRARTAEHGHWAPSPGYELFGAVKRSLGKLEIIAEDLGAVVPQARTLRDHFHFPGMRILQIGFGEGARYDQPHNYVRNCAAYAGTHDNDTAVGWFRGLSKGAAGQRRGKDGLTDRQRAMRYLSSDGREIHWDMIRALHASVADTAIVPMQDILGLGSLARMNTPATPTGNWGWRMKAGELTPAHAREIRELAEIYERLPKL